MCMAKESSWKDFINTEFVQWRKDKRGKAGSAAQLAREIGVSPQLLNGWMNKGQIPTDQEYINKLVNFFGLKVYDALGLRRPDSDDPRVALQVFGFPPEVAERIAGNLSLVLKRSLAKMEENGISKDSPEGFEIINDELSKLMPPTTDTK